MNVNPNRRAGRLAACERLTYVFVLGDDRAHLCTVDDRRVDPMGEISRMPDRPVP